MPDIHLTIMATHVSGSTFRPMLPVALEVEGKRVLTWALIDCGASCDAIVPRLVRGLGIEVRRAWMKITAFGGERKVEACPLADFDVYSLD